MKKAMRSRSMVGLLAAVGLITTLALAARPHTAGAAPTRKKVTCEEYRRDVESSSKSIGISMVFKPGDWGKTPPALRVLPPNASLCGSHESLVEIASPLTGKDLVNYYTPILQKLGCKAPKCEIGDKKTFCSCFVEGVLARIGTEERYETYGITWLSMSLKK
jgi:hypothetical protein